jgi:hypothetical protein
MGLLGLLILLLPLLVGCGESAAPTEPPQPTEIAKAGPTTTPTELPPTDTPVPTEPPPTNTPVPTATPTPEPIDDSGCITCHTSEESLQALAEEEEKPEVESEGEG